MAQMLTPDDIDFSAYMRDTDARAKVREASKFVEDLTRRFLPRDPDKRRAGMVSTKLRDKLEFRPGEVTAWAGYNGHRKSMFTGQVALDLCCQREKVLIASLEMDPADTLARMCRQAFGVASPAILSVKRFADWTDDRLWMFDHVGRIKPAEIVAVVRYFAEELKGTQVFIDSMMMVCASEEHLDEQKQFVTDIVRAAQEFSVHIHVVAHCRKPQSGAEDKPPSKYDLRGSAAISDQCHNVLTVWANKAKQQAQSQSDFSKSSEPDAAVTVEKQRNGAWEGRAKLWFHDASMRFMDEMGEPAPYKLFGEPA
jgi:twinkle protein